MSVSSFDTPSPIAVTLDLYVADVRFDVSDRTDTSVEVRPSDPDKAADIRASVKPGSISQARSSCRPGASLARARRAAARRAASRPPPPRSP